MEVHLRIHPSKSFQGTRAAVSDILFLTTRRTFAPPFRLQPDRIVDAKILSPLKMHAAFAVIVFCRIHPALPI
jgi:hypothetical protein